MNTQTIGMYILKMITIWAAISGCFYLSKTYVLDTRVKKDTKAPVLEIIATFVCAAIITGIIGGLAGKYNNSLTLAVFIVLTLASFAGLWLGFEMDSKLTNEQKILKRVKEKEEADRNPSTDY